MILYRNWRYTITIFEEERKWRDKKEKKENLNDELIGFSAINQNHLEALFLDPAKIGQGFGKQMMQSLIHDFGVTTVDVNKDNENAMMFYMKSGFSIVSESLTDDAGRPYPILHLKLKSK